MNIMAKELNIDEGRCRKLAWFVVLEKNPRLSHPIFDTVSINTRLGALFVSYYGFVERKDFWNAAAAAGQIVYSLMEIEKFSEARNAAKIMFANSGGNRLIAAAIGNSFFDYDDETGGEKGYYMLLGAVESDEEFNEIVSCCEQYYPVKPGIDWRSYLATAYMLFFVVIFLGPIVLGLVRIFLPQFAPPW